MRALILTGLLALTACSDLPPPKPPQVVGATPAGAEIYQFRITSANALGWTPVSEQEIVRRANGICPGGYRELGRTGEATRRISGVFYVDIDVQITCL